MRATGDPVRLVAAAAAVLLMSAADNTPAQADMTVVQQDKTPIVSWPASAAASSPTSTPALR